MLDKKADLLWHGLSGELFRQTFTFKGRIVISLQISVSEKRHLIFLLQKCKIYNLDIKYKILIFFLGAVNSFFTFLMS